MKSYVALLYSIILGEGRRVVMADLRQMAERLGYRSPRTLVATGNLIFEAPVQPLADIESSLEEAFLETFGRHVDIIVRSADGWLKLAADNPFLATGEEDPTSVHIRVMRSPLAPDVLDGLRSYCSRGERVAIVGGDLWADFGGKASESKLLGAVTTKRLGIGTWRNWNTVKGLRAMLGG
ncbi:uncharacterized protein (DUF1697 family) [Sinorhizobium fredii]|uniref:DUF1697 domain-containing protein n=1 Tax=Sinorhizobium fredii (strain USDA 257) TaxID=1185652 RepID=I3X812_SINF2|nr:MULTISPECIES: DUF1697 domain-containing protein [Sinorhizobium]AFL52018.1 hypothetical protein USDA257_c34590 [Sinorhizobium fredii USDA 257]PDT80966.1 DUF1697 domain-containing protein [Sinorhizobium sp. BJ1]